MKKILILLAVLVCGCCSEKRCREIAKGVYLMETAKVGLVKPNVEWVSDIHTECVLNGTVRGFKIGLRSDGILIWEEEK